MTNPEEAYVAQFAAARDSLPGSDLPWLATLREEGIDRFFELGFATPKNEVWKYTNLRALVKTPFAAASAVENGIHESLLAPYRLSGETHSLVFVNGFHRADLSRLGELPAGVEAGGLASILETDPEAVESHLGRIANRKEQSLVALNTALMADGAVVILGPGIRVDEPIHLLFVATGREKPAAFHLRNLIVAAPGSAVTIVETYLATDEGSYWTDATTEVVAATGAEVRHVKLQSEGSEAFHLASTQARLEDEGRYDSFDVSLGARLARNEIHTVLSGTKAQCRLRGVFLGRRRQHLDTTTVIDHRQADSVSEEVYKGVLDDTARGVFQGKIIVRPGAQKTDARQMNKNLLLSTAARMNTKPELRIDADDVKCSHGATVGDLDPEALFYLRARGLDEVGARRLLIGAFIDELVTSIDVPAARAHCGRAISRWLGHLSTRAHQ